MEFILFMSAYLLGYLLFFILGILIHEFGHLVCGLLTGYKFNSYRFFSFIIFRKNGKLTIERSSNNLSLGQCLMDPPLDKENFKFILFNLGGGIFNLFTAIIMLCFAIAYLDSDTLFGLFFGGFFSSLILGLFNLIPLDFGLPNDGKNILEAMKSKEAKNGFYLMLLINSLTTQGKRMRDIDPSLFEISDDIDTDNYFAIYPIMLRAEYFNDVKDYDKSINLYQKLELDKLPKYYSFMVKMELVYYYLTYNKDYEKAKELYLDPSSKPFMKLKIPPISRVMSTYEFYVNGNITKAKEILEQAIKDTKKFPNKGIRIMELEQLKELEQTINKL